ncbi:ATP-grasp domain protein [Rubripirellula lacrimiformis]|uniref:ATP-grasp domain protein n=1 Tax=Rubripirellula lacrimiformis TaxID=1930273 RepID=A0A517NI78_9BACT|nr:ATP-grasp domain-containing protein [Rubripirellula lacrimiformis]QDT06788.1 ATP-grasp domain protein [Rubripirellula lacrimiformis]
MQPPEPSKRPDPQPNQAVKPRKQTIVMVGASIRAAAQSAQRAGYLVHGMDLFGDQDTRQACSHFTDLNDRDAIQAWMSEQDSNQPIVQVGGVSRIAERLGGAADRLRPSLTRQAMVAAPANLKRWAESAGLHYPETVDVGDPRVADAGGRWLTKSQDSSGGLGVRWFGPTDPDATAPGLLQSPSVQRWIPGRSMGATFMLGSRGAKLLGVCRSFHQSMVIGGLRYPFVYAGSAGPFPCPSWIADRLVQMGNRIADATGLVGLCNLDFVLDRQGRTWLLEANPRWSGSSELIEHPSIQHVDRSQGNHSQDEADSGFGNLRSVGGSLANQASPTRCPSLLIASLSGDDWPSSTELPGHGFGIKRVVFARATFRFRRDRVHRLLDPHTRIADVPPDGSVIAKGMPVCTLIWHGGFRHGSSDMAVRPTVGEEPCRTFDRTFAAVRRSTGSDCKPTPA